MGKPMKLLHKMINEKAVYDEIAIEREKVKFMLEDVRFEDLGFDPEELRKLARDFKLIKPNWRIIFEHLIHIGNAYDFRFDHIYSFQLILIVAEMASNSSMSIDSEAVTLYCCSSAIMQYVNVAPRDEITPEYLFPWFQWLCDRAADKPTVRVRWAVAVSMYDNITTACRLLGNVMLFEKLLREAFDYLYRKTECDPLRVQAIRGYDSLQRKRVEFLAADA